MKFNPGSCVWKLNWDGKETTFKSDWDLDVELLSKLNENPYLLEDKQVPIHVVASMSAADVTNEKIDKIREEVKNAGIEIFKNGEDTEKILYIPHSIGVTRFLQQYIIPGDDGPMVTPFSEEVWTKNRIAEYKNQGKSEEEAVKLVKTEKASWTTMAEIGTEIHAIFQKVFDPDAPDTKFKFLRPELITEVQNQAELFKQSLIAKYGDGCKFYAELPIVSDELDPSVKEFFGDSIKSINGKIDLLVVDAHGNAHIYDFKVSRKYVDDELWDRITDNDVVENHNKEQSSPDEKWWHSTKREGASHQLAMYSLMLAQKDIHVTDAHIVPIKTTLEYADDAYLDVVGVKTVNTQYQKGKIVSSLPQVLHGKYRTNASSVLINKWKSLGSVFSAMNNIYSTFFPRATAKSNEQSEKKASIEYYKNKPSYTTKLKPSDPLYNEKTDANGNIKGGYRYAFVDKDFKGAKKHFFKTEEELNAYIEGYAARVAQSSVDSNIALADELKSVLDSKGTIDDFAVHADRQSFIRSEFARYFDGQWMFKYDPELNSLGIFVFEKGGVIEIVSTTTTQLRSTINLGMGTTLLGKTTKNKHADTATILTATGGHMELMRVMSYIALTPENFEDKHISNVRVVNLQDGMEDVIENSRLIENYNELRKHNPEAKAPAIKTSIFLSDVESCLFDVRERLNSIEPDILNEFDINQMDLNAKAIRNMISTLENKYKDKLSDERDYNKYDPIWQAYVSLKKALLFTEGHSLVTETDVDNYYRGGLDLNGLMVSSMQFSPSTNIRVLGEIINKFANAVRSRIQTLGWPMKKAFKDLYDEHGVGADAFKTWFETDEFGNISKEFKLKDPSLPEFDGDPTSRKALDMFLKTMARLRWGDNIPEADLEEYKRTGKYYEVPLTEAVGSRQLKNVGLIQTLKNKYQQYSELTADVFAGTDIEEVHASILKEKHLFNKMRLTDEARRTRLEENFGMYETDLERVMNEALYLYSKETVSKEYLPVISGLQLVLRHMDEYGGGDDKKDKTHQMTNIRTVAERLIKSKVYGENVIEGDKLRALYKWLNILKAGFTTLTLSLNVRSFLRESLQGIWTGVSRAMVEVLPGVSGSSYTKALLHVIQESHKNFSSVSKLQQLNEKYAMANQSLTQIAGQRRLSWGNIKHWGKDTLFLTATAPDFMHRVSILVAKMMGDGCWDAHVLNDDGELVYDYKLDNRFKDYRENNTSSPNYLKQKSLYLKMLEEFKKEGLTNKDGSELKEGDDLPQAYTSKTAQAIKNYSDLLYGHYDDESRSLLCDTFVGSFFLQYKTFVTAKLEQWTMEGGIYSTHLLELQQDSNGETLYEGIEYTSFDKDGNPVGMPERNIITETEFKKLSNEEQSKYRVYYDYSGLPMEGMAKAQLGFVKNLCTANIAEITEMAKDPTERGYFMLGFHDMWLMCLLEILAQFIFGSAVGAKSMKRQDIYAQIKKSDPITQLAYNVVTGSFQDSQFFNVLGNFTQAPPMITSAQRFARNTMATLTGHQTLGYTVVRSFGALSDLQGIVKRFQD